MALQDRKAKLFSSVMDDDGVFSRRSRPTTSGGCSRGDRPCSTRGCADYRRQNYRREAIQ